MPDRNQSPPGPGIIKNRGGRPRNDGTRADNAKTLAELGISKRMAALARLYASIPLVHFGGVLNDECLEIWRWQLDDQNHRIAREQSRAGS